MPPQRRSLFPPFAGVALADILANSVAIVIIMIVVTLMNRYQEEQDRLAQTENLAVLLSRELATSFVMNALPTSPPARLHDYVASPLDRNPRHATMPIIELHDDYVREHYTGRTFTREELLRQDNALDAYLASLTPFQLAALRVDIYGIRQFYIAMSIFKGHGHQPRHWHFLAGEGDHGGYPGGPRALATSVAPEVPLADGQRGGLVGRADAAGVPSAPSAASALPEDVALALAGGSEAYPGDAQFGGGGGDERLQYFDLPGGVDESASMPVVAGAAASGETEAASGSQDSSSASAGPKLRFRPAVQSDGAEDVKQSFADMTSVLRGLLAYMAEQQAAADAALPSGLARFDFSRDVLERARRLPPPDAQQSRMLRSLAFLLETPRKPESTAVELEIVGSEDVLGQALTVFASEPVQRAAWLRDGDQPEPQLLAAESTSNALPTARVTLHLGLHAAIHEGLRLPLQRHSLLLLPESGDSRQEPRWRIVTLVNAERDDFVLGFVYAGLDAGGRLLLPVDENAVEIGGVRVESQFANVRLRDDFRQLLLFGALTALFAGGVVFRTWRRR